MSGRVAGGALPKYRFAVLSAVKHDYVPRAVAAHPRCELAVVADDADQPQWVHDRNRQLAEEFSVPYVIGVERALEEHPVQAAVVSSQVQRHCDLSIRAIERGLHVIQDKPMSHSLAECDRLVEAARRRNVRFLMWNRNGMPAVWRTGRLVAEGAIGAVRAVHVDFYFAKDAGPPKSHPQPQPIDWQTHQIAAHVDGSDGGLADRPLGELEIEGVYPLAHLRLLSGARVKSVFARTARHFHQLNADNNVDDLGSLSLELEDGVLATVCVGRIGRASHPNLGEIKLHVIGEKGSLAVNEPRPETAIYYRGQPAGEMRHRRVAVDNDHLLVENFLSAVESESETLLDARASRDISATVFAALESARLGRRVAPA